MSAAPPHAWPDERLAAGAERLAARHLGHFSIETVRQLLANSHQLLAEDAWVRTHLVVLAEKLTAERLEALAHNLPPGRGSGVVRVLFVCGHNAGRSQIAAALLVHRGGERVVVSSAGTEPAAVIEPPVERVLLEAGLSVADASPKPLAPEVAEAADFVITMGCGDACPVVAGRHYLDWPVADPGGAPIGMVRAIRDDIDARITDLLAALPGA